MPCRGHHDAPRRAILCVIMLCPAMAPLAALAYLACLPCGPSVCQTASENLPVGIFCVEVSACVRICVQRGPKKCLVLCALVVALHLASPAAQVLSRLSPRYSTPRSPLLPSVNTSLLVLLSFCSAEWLSFLRLRVVLPRTDSFSFDRYPRPGCARHHFWSSLWVWMRGPGPITSPPTTVSDSKAS